MIDKKFKDFDVLDFPKNTSAVYVIFFIKGKKKRLFMLVKQIGCMVE